MSKKDKLLREAANNPHGLSFNNFETLVSQCGWVLSRQNGSHQVWSHPKYDGILSIQNKKGMAKGYQVKQFFSKMELINSVIDGDCNE